MQVSYYASIALLLMILWPQSGQAQNPDRDSLKGLQELFVLIERPPQSAIDIGITEEQLKTDVELRLRKAGITVKDKADSYLYINVNVIASNDKRACIYHVNVTLNQHAYLERDKNILVAGATWERGSLGGNSSDTVKTDIRGVLGDLVD